MNLSGRQRDLLKRYGLAVALAVLVLRVRGALPVPIGTTIYQLPLAAVVLAGWFGGRGPGPVALLICTVVIFYAFLPPEYSRVALPEYQLGLILFVCLGLLLMEFSGARRRVEQALRESEERFRARVQFSFDVRGSSHCPCSSMLWTTPTQYGSSSFDGVAVDNAYKRYGLISAIMNVASRFAPDRRGSDSGTPPQLAQ